MNIKQIKYFVSVFDRGSLSAAAKDQYVTVQAVSKAIADLERELKSDLFVRQSRGMRPTLFGKSFYAKAEPVLRIFDELEEFAHSYQDSGALTLRLALCTPPFQNNERARASIAAFVGKNLGMDATVALATIAKGMEGLRAGVYDALITVGPCERPDTDCLSVGTVSPGVLVAADHPLASQGTVALEDLEPYPTIVVGSFDTFNAFIMDTYRDRGVDVRHCDLNRVEFDEFLAAKKGAAFITGIPALGRLHPQSVMRLVAPEDAVPIPVCLISLKNRKSHAYCVFERWMVEELLLLGGNSIGRLAAAAVSPPTK